MPSYYYRACDEQGTIFEGKEKAASEEQVLAFLQDRKLRPIQIDTRSKFKPLSFEESIAQRFPVPKQQIAVLFDQLGIMLGSGISIEEALLSVEEHTTNYRLRTSLKHIRKNVSEGIPLHTVMMDHSDIFSETIIRVVEVGEHSGQLDVSLLRLAEMLEFDQEIHRRFKEATRYPKIVCFTLGISLLLIVNLVIPKFARLFQQSNLDLPIFTQILLTTYYFTSENWSLLLFAFLLLYVLYILLKKERKFSESLERFRMHIPVLGSLELKIELNRIFRILSLLIESGVDILKSIKLVSQITQNKLLSNALLDIRTNLENGQSLPMALGETPYFPRMAKRMISIGEKTGQLSASLAKVSDIYERETSITIKKMSSYMEPFLIFIIGIMVIVFALGIFLPMWDLIKVVR